MYDVAVVGAGPAGVSAAINLKLLNKNFIWLASEQKSGKAARAELIKNYPGLPDVTGEQLCWAFLNHAEGMGLHPERAVVTGIYDTVGKFTLLAGEKQYEAQSVIICTGVTNIKTIEGEEEFLGRGVSNCATCDGVLYKGKKIAVISFDKSFEHEAEYLCSLAREVVFVPAYKGENITARNARVLRKIPARISGGLRAQRLEFSDGQIEEADGVFVLRTAIAPSSLMRGLECDESRIIVDRSCAASVAGVFAAGDCTGAPYQYAKSVGEGNIAAHSAARYLSSVKK